MRLHFFLVNFAEWVKNVWNVECASMHSRTLNTSTTIPPQMHFHYWQTDTLHCDVFCSIEIYFGENGTSKREKAALQAKISEWIFEWQRQQQQQQQQHCHGCGAVECCCSWLSLNDFIQFSVILIQRKCDLKRWKIVRQKYLSLRHFVSCDGLELFLPTQKR